MAEVPVDNTPAEAGEVLEHNPVEVGHNLVEAVVHSLAEAAPADTPAEAGHSPVEARADSVRRENREALLR